MAHGIPFSDTTRENVFRRAVEDFQDLSETYERVIVEETLHKSSFRDILYAGARAHFGTYGVVWVKADEATALSRLETRSQAGHILQDPARMYAGFAAVFEPIVEADIVHDNSGPLDESVRRLADELATHAWATKL
jgi:gluconate kinase